jgi:serine protease Do
MTSQRTRTPLGRRHGAIVTIGLCVAGAQASAVRAGPLDDAQASVVRVIATARGGEEMSGSSVVIAPERLATNCHVVRDAAAIFVEAGDRRLPARLYAGDGEKDLCLLVAPGLPNAPARLRSSFDLDEGEPVIAVGFPAGEARVSAGAVESTHRFQDAHVIRTSARFERGASGGGLFTRTGELVGILTFKTPRGEAFHFAIPVDWIACVEEGLAQPSAPTAKTFWEHEPARAARFLQATWLRWREDWLGLRALAKRWLAAEPNNPEARAFLTQSEDRGRTPIITSR